MYRQFLMDDEIAKQLLSSERGKESLLVIFCCRFGIDVSKLQFSEDQLNAAISTLKEVGYNFCKETEEDPSKISDDELADILNNGDGYIWNTISQVGNAFNRKLNIDEIRRLVELTKNNEFSDDSIILLSKSIAEKHRLAGQDRIYFEELMAAVRFFRKEPDRSPKTIQAYITQQRGFYKRVAALLQNNSEIRYEITLRNVEIVINWFALGFSDEMIELAAYKAKRKRRPISIDYMNGIIRQWYNQGLFTPDQVNAAEERYWNSN